MQNETARLAAFYLENPAAAEAESARIRAEVDAAEAAARGILPAQYRAIREIEAEEYFAESPATLVAAGSIANGVVEWVTF